MKKINTDDKYLKATVFREYITDRLATIADFKLSHPESVSSVLDSLNSELVKAQNDTRFYPNEEHFKQWEGLIDRTDAELIRVTLFN